MTITRRLRRTLSLLAFLLLNTASAVPLPWNYLYEVRDVSGVVGYLFGSAHAGINELSGDLSQCVASRLASSKKLVLETNVFEAMIRPYSGTERTSLMELGKDWSEEEKTQLSRFALNGCLLDRAGSPSALAIFSALDTSFHARGGMVVGVSADVRLMAAAMAASMPMTRLESVDEPQVAMVSMPREAMPALIRQRLLTPADDALAVSGGTGLPKLL